jgi:uncharacterized CHY-type Zn-finger protein
MSSSSGGSWDGSATAVADPGTLVSGEMWPMEEAPPSEFDQAPYPADWPMPAAADGEDPSAGIIGGASEEMGNLEYHAPSSRGACCSSCAAGGECEGGCGGDCSGGCGGSCSGRRSSQASGGARAMSGAGGGPRYAGAGGGCDAEFEHDCCYIPNTYDSTSPVTPNGSGSTTGTASVGMWPGFESSHAGGGGAGWTAADKEMCELCGGTWDDYACPEGEKKKIMCGPDVTDWLVDRLIENRQWLSRQNLKLAAWALRVLGEGNFNEEYDFGGSDPECPIDCPRTVTLCGKCVTDDVPEDINFAYAGSDEFSNNGLRAAADIAAGGFDKESAHVSFTAGFLIDATVRAYDIDPKNPGTKKLKIILCEHALANLAVSRNKDFSTRDCPICPNKFNGKKKKKAPAK